MEDRMTAQKLKNSILQMAVQGKLVPQDPNDEPASVLLERIRKEKEQLIKEGKIKRNKNESYIFRGADNLHYEQIGKEVRCIEDELPFEIPDNWEWTRLNSVGSMARGNGIKRNEVVENGYPCIRYGEIYTSYNLFFKDSISHVDNNIYNSSKKIKRNDLIYTLTGENKPDIAKTVAYLGEEDIAAGGDLAVWSNHQMNPLYLSYLLSSPYMISNKVKLATGDIIVHISVDKVGLFIAPIPPLEEQNRIVKKILILEELIKEYSEKEEELYKLNSSIKEQLKKSILQYAIEGKLVPQDPNDEPASVLLERIHKEKSKLIAEGKIKKDKNESIIYRRDNSYYEKLNNNEKCIDDQITFEIPDNWCWARLGSIGDWKAGTTPSKSNTEYYKNGSIPWLLTGDLNDGLIQEIPNKITEKAMNETSMKLNPSGSILIAMYGATIGKLGILPLPAATNQACCACNVIQPFYNLYLFYFLMANKTNFLKQGEGGAQPNISREKIIKTLIPIPPANEQHNIVSKIERINSILANL